MIVAEIIRVESTWISNEVCNVGKSLLLLYATVFALLLGFVKVTLSAMRVRKKVV